LRPGLHVLDEPEAALSIHGQMVLARLISESVAVGGQFLIATHSPFLLASPGATVYELDDQEVSRVAFDELAATSLWRRFLDDPEHFSQQLLDP
jgi:predicted ATPase